MKQKMTRAGYEDLLGKTLITDDITVREAKQRAGLKNRLRSYLHAQTLEHIKETHGIDLEAERVGWTSYTIDFTNGVKPTGSVLVRQFGHDDWVPAKLLHEWRVPKAALFV